MRIDDGEGSVRGDGRVDGISAHTEDLEASQGGEVVRRRDHAVTGLDWRNY